MTIRTFQPGDEVAQVSIYNEAAGDLPKFKPATLDEVRRRLRDPDFDPATRFYAVADGRPVGYATFQPSGRVSFPWCRKGHEALAEPLLDPPWRRCGGAACRGPSPPTAATGRRRCLLRAHGFAPDAGDDQLRPRPGRDADAGGARRQPASRR